MYMYILLLQIAKKIRKLLIAKPPVCTFIIPFVRLDVQSTDFTKCIDDMGTQEGVNILREIFIRIRSILGPVCVITHSFVFC
jgi:hypothetical protein